MTRHKHPTDFCMGLIVWATYLAGATANAAIPANYATTTIPSPTGSQSGSTVTTFGNVNLAGINNSGQVVGTSLKDVRNTGPLNDVRSYVPFIYGSTGLAQMGNLGLPLAVPAAINNNGLVVGFKEFDQPPVISQPLPYVPYFGSYGAVSFPVNAGTMLPFGAALAVNDLGQMAGYQFSSTFHLQSVLYSNGQIAALPVLNPSVTSSVWNAARGINDNGQIVGESSVTTSTRHAFLYSNGTIADLQTLGGPDSSATAINAFGEIVGYSGISGTGSTDVYHAFIDINNTMTDIGTLGGDQSWALGINAAGDVVGMSETGAILNNQPVDHAFLYSNGQMIDLNALVNPLAAGDYLTQAVGINDLGQIAVNSANGSYVLTPTPTPEPATFVLIAASASLLLKRTCTTKKHSRR